MARASFLTRRVREDQIRASEEIGDEPEIEEIKPLVCLEFRRILCSNLCISISGLLTGVALAVWVVYGNCDDGNTAKSHVEQVARIADDVRQNGRDISDLSANAHHRAEMIAKKLKNVRQRGDQSTHKTGLEDGDIREQQSVLLKPLKTTDNREQHRVQLTTPLNAEQVDARKQATLANSVNTGGNQNSLIDKNRALGLGLLDAYGPKHWPVMMAECRSFLENMSFENPRWTSQCFQDFWLFNHIFAPLMEKGLVERTYVDVGAHDFKRISNLYVFDICFGFRGVCGEPKKENHQNIRRFRRCELVDTCLSDKEEVIEFLFHGGESGLASTHSVHLKRPEAVIKENLTCKRLQPVLDKTNISYVSFMSLDVEGGEFKVLGGIDMSKTTVGLILWEQPSTPESREKVLSHVKSLGYRMLTLPNGRNPISKDYIFIHSSFPLQPEEIMKSIEYRCDCFGCKKFEAA